MIKIKSTLLMSLGLVGALVLNLSPASAMADEKISLTLKDHVFIPDHIHAPAGVKIEITVKNEDGSAEEFDSRDLKREKVIGGGKEGVVLVGPFTPGIYHFQGEYHAKTAQGILEIQ